MTATANATFDAKAAALTAAWQQRVRERQAAQLAASEPEEVPLPSGLTVLAVRANFLSLLEAGKIPDALTPYAMDLLNQGKRGESAVTEGLVERFAEWVALMDVVWLACVTVPVFTADGVLSDGAIPMRTVDLEDKIAFFNWSNGVADHLAAFRDAGAAARNLPDGEDVRPGPAANDGSDGPAGGVGLPASRFLRRAHGGGSSAGDAAGADAGPGPGSEGPALVTGEQVDLGASGRPGAAAARRERRGRRADARA